MSADPLTDLSRLCVHTITTKPWAIEQAAERYAAAGVKGITVWRQALEGRDIAATGEMLRGHDLKVVSLCRGGFFPYHDGSGRKQAIDDNLKAIDEAEALGAPLIVLVCGAQPGLLLDEARRQIQAGIEEVLPRAIDAGVKLAIEPLHPMYADCRSAVNTIGQANDMAEAIGSDHVGVAVDVYHLWWDPDLETEIHRCARSGSLLAFHVCDWKTPTVDMLNDRGLMGEGCIPIREIRSWVEAAGFSGFNEVEIFSDRYCSQDQGELLEHIIEAYRMHV